MGTCGLGPALALVCFFFFRHLSLPSLLHAVWTRPVLAATPRTELPLSTTTLPAVPSTLCTTVSWSTSLFELPLLCINKEKFKSYPALGQCSLSASHSGTAWSFWTLNTDEMLVPFLSAELQAVSD